MARSLNGMIATLPLDEQETIEARYQELKHEVEGLRELRQITGKAQEDIAMALNVKQPSVSKIEKQADMYLSTLRGYVEAIGGKLELTVKLPARPALRLQSLGDVSSLNVPAPGVARRQKSPTVR
ncbi:XRE family transcriptional regulator [Brucella pseudintermedia]|uniref:XRE family transcriptional regulator n=1 Tax=Brucella pseudintermedia TaxID=370111 RepID=UPI00124EF419|nr:XRE family transcriptional regulator [Brucella pseudintermedia]KAB2680962.1 XRE family transcriptional regulator [Brucella pseudintermedia]